MTNINIRVISDPVCPACYLGKSRLERAISLYRKTYPGGENDTFTLSWHPFYLDPRAPRKGINIKEYLASRMSPAQMKIMTAHMAEMGRAEGLNYTFDGKFGHTRDAHRVVQLAKTKGSEVENRVVGTIMKSFFEEGGDITSKEMLVEAAVHGGLERGETANWLNEGKGGNTVDKEVEAAVLKGVKGVPRFYIDEKYEVYGAQDVEEFLQQIILAKDGAKRTKSKEGITC
ncbi:DSBA-like thioredoxin domain-containing protein [Aspergillus bertholletiae]|uniref:DSBA-like thioredoxin domain-containing protein n=1 Tax=Aspergillus bertholletiae TaxID=1226010 RepID=A0A5N7AQZ4_9EURO|nr:DSBA-like thioredoxin domain-containing protein [Aspergillus bertholletiae]